MKDKCEGGGEGWRVEGVNSHDTEVFREQNEQESTTHKGRATEWEESTNIYRRNDGGVLGGIERCMEYGEWASIRPHW